MLVLIILACIAFLLGLIWLSQHDLGLTGEVALYILLGFKWLLITALFVFLILTFAYIVSVR